MPQVGVIIVLVLSSLVILVNTLAMVSILRNYRRLRQRMYLFIISLTAVHITCGIAFTADAIMVLLRQSDVTTSSDVECASSFDGITVIEGLKCASIVLTAFNAIILTYALHKRTTSMGRHRSESTSITSTDGAMGLQLPAFDTMMRVLSLGTSQNKKSQPEGKKKSNHEKSTTCESSFSENTTADSKADYSSVNRDDEIVKPMTAVTANNNRKTARTCTHNQRGKHHSALSALLVPRPSVIRRRSKFTRAGSQSYVGRHGNSVVSVRVTLGLLTVIWVAFVVMWLTPVISRSNKSTGDVIKNGLRVVDFFMCPLECDSKETSPFVYNVKHANSEDVITASTEETTDDYQSLVPFSGSPYRVRHRKNKNETYVKKDSDLSTHSSFAVISNLTDEESGEKSDVDGGEEKELDMKKGMPLVMVNSADPLTRSVGRSSPPMRSSCFACSSYFYPLSKVHVMFNALMIVVTWLYLFYSSLRLLWLRKHSNNVFVRCSALWRFILFTAIFYMAASLPYVVICVSDIATHGLDPPEIYATSIIMPNRTLFINKTYPLDDSQAFIDVMQRGDNPIVASQSQPNNVAPSDLTSQVSCTATKSTYVVMSSCFLLLHSAISPLSYLIRFLGFRRLISSF